MSTATPFNFQIVIGADVTRGKAGLKDISSGLQEVSNEAGKATQATKAEAAALRELASATAKAALSQSNLASAENRAAEGRRRASAIPHNVLSQNTRNEAMPVAAFRATETAAASLTQSVSGLNTMLNASVDEMMHATVEARSYRESLDEIRAAFNPLFAASKQYEAHLDAIARAERVGAISTQEAAAARERAAAMLAPNGRSEPGASAGPSSFVTANLASQGNDILVMMAAGQNPLQLALQQGTQVSQVLNQVGGDMNAVRAIGAGFVSMINPISLATIGIIGFGAAGVQWLMSLREKAKEFEDSMADLGESLDSYDRNMARARSSTQDLSREFGSAADEVRRLSLEMAELDRRAAQRAAADVLGGLRSELGLRLTSVPDAGIGSDANRWENRADALEDRRRDADNLRKLFGLDQTPEAQSLVTSVLDAVAAANSAEGLDAQIEALETLRAAWLAAAEAQGGISVDEDEQLAKFQEATEKLARLRAVQNNEAGLQQAREVTRNLLQQVALEEARVRFGEDSAELRAVEARHEREQLELKLEGLGLDRQSLQWRTAMLAFWTRQAQIEQAANEARREWFRDQDDKLAAIQRETSLIGASASEQARINALAEAELEIRDRKLTVVEAEEARLKAIARAEAEIAQTRQRALYDVQVGRMMDAYDARLSQTRDPWIRADIEAEREYARSMADTRDAVIARANADRVRETALRDIGLVQTDHLRGQAESLQQMRLELALLGQSAVVRARVLALLQAERDIQRLGATGDRAEDIRRQALAQVEMARAIESQADAWQRVQSAGEGAIDGILDKLRGGDIKGAFAELIGEIEAGFFDLAIRNPLKNLLLGTNLGTFDSIGGWDGIWGRLTGRNPIDETSVIQNAVMPVQSMTVQAANVTLSGDLSGLPGQLRAANTTGAPMQIPGQLPGSGDVQSQIWQFFAGKGLQPHQIAGIMGNVAAESSFNPLAVGDDGKAYGLFQWNNRRHQLFDFIGGQQNLGDIQKQLEFAWHELMTSEGPAYQRLLAATDTRSATEAFLGFERPKGFNLADPTGSEAYARRIAAAEAAIAKFEETTVTAQQQLGQMGTGAAQLGTGLQSFGSSVAGIIQSAGAKRGIGGSLVGSLLTSLGKTIGIPGFATGGDHSGGWRIVGENGPELEATGASRIFNAAQTREILTSGPAMMPGPAANLPAAPATEQRVVYEINVSGTGDREIIAGVHSAIQQSFDQFVRDHLPGEVKLIVNDRWGS